MAATEWTLEELIGMVAAVLDGTGYEGAPNGRVQDLPDVRAVRWYTSIGLLDRPRARGRARIYGPRHYLQLVAIKRRQAQGFKIAEIQAELANAPDDVLLRIAKLPPGVAFRVDPTPAERLSAIMHPDSPPPRRFWAMPPSEFMPAVAHEPSQDERSQDERSQDERSRDEPSRDERGQDEDERRDQGKGRDEAEGHGEAVRDRRNHGDQSAGQEARDALITGVPLGGGVVLLLPTTPTGDDVARIRETTRELMGLLASRGLVTATDDVSRPDNKTGFDNKTENETGADDENEPKENEPKEQVGIGTRAEDEGQKERDGGGRKRRDKARLQDEIKDSTNAGASRTKRRGSAV
ncbi:MerR family transcriptional regulator [Dactylosporangium sp. CA-139066]|uniref:MerR family transcriptional regulator n=1 Tax=Dactylosporangium sp. CA-139066 TaxID=3239930 RepID=UPI003D90DBC6